MGDQEEAPSKQSESWQTFFHREESFKRGGETEGSLTSRLRPATKSKNPLERPVKGQNKHFLNG